MFKGVLVVDYIQPGEVISPKASWSLFDVILDRGAGNCAYALGTWNGERRVGFRWNGDSDAGRLGNPQSRGLPTWTMLDSALHQAVLDLLPADKRALAKGFLAIHDGEGAGEALTTARALHAQHVEAITAGTWPCLLQDGARLLLQIVPFSAVIGMPSRIFSELFRNPTRFPPISAEKSRPSPPAEWRIAFDGLLCGSNASGLKEPQRASVHISQRGIVESVVSIGLGQDHDFIESPKVIQIIIRYARFYARSLYECGIDGPFAVSVSLQNVKGARLLQDVIGNSLAVDIPCSFLKEPSYTFTPAVFEAAPETESEAARVLLPMLDHVAQAAGLPNAPCFDAGGKYLWRDYAW